jgi:hypothetical protein
MMGLPKFYEVDAILSYEFARHEREIWFVTDTRNFLVDRAYGETEVLVGGSVGRWMLSF